LSTFASGKPQHPFWSIASGIATEKSQILVSSFWSTVWLYTVVLVCLAFCLVVI